MIKSFLFVVLLSFLSASVKADSLYYNFLECSAKIQGGVDVFPWSIAKPFPWNSIQGIWKLKDDGAFPTYLKAKVVRTTSNRKILSLLIVTEGDCSKPLAKGVGYIDLSEKNVVRAIMNDGSSKYQMKLALFNSKDLFSDTFGCEESIMAASIQMFENSKTKRTISVTDDLNDHVENIMLKKVSDDMVSVCKKLGSR